MRSAAKKVVQGTHFLPPIEVRFVARRSAPPEMTSTPPSIVPNPNNDPDGTHYIAKAFAEIFNDFCWDQAGQEAKDERGDKQAEKRVYAKARDQHDQRDDG
jgi:hypothetical protein